MNVVSKPRQFLDSLINLVSGLGGASDKGIYNQFTFVPTTQQQLEAAYRGDWVARKIVDIPASDMTRMWRSWQSSNDIIEDVENLEKELFVRQKVRRALKLARLYGGSALVMGISNAGNMSEELDLNSVKKDSLKFIHAVSRYEVATGQVVRDLTSPLFGEPEYYSRNTAGADIDQGRIHPSRVIKLVGSEYPNLDNASDVWGDSVLQAVLEAVLNVASTTSGVATLVQEAKIDVIRIPNFMTNLTTKEYTDRITERFRLASVGKSTVNTLMLDKEEEWQRITTSFASLPDVLKMYLLIACGAADIPATRMLGQSAQGLNATGEGDLRNHYDRIKSDQENDLSPVLTRLDEVIVRSATGTMDPGIFYNWNSLWQMDESQKAEVAVKKASVFKTDVDAGIISPEVLKIGRENQLIEDGTYPGIEEAIEEEGGDWDPLENIAQEKEAAQAAAEAKAAMFKQAVPPKPGQKPKLKVVGQDFNPNHVQHGEYGGQFESGQGHGSETGHRVAHHVAHAIGHHVVATHGGTKAHAAEGHGEGKGKNKKVKLVLTNEEKQQFGTIVGNGVNVRLFVEGEESSVHKTVNAAMTVAEAKRIALLAKPRKKRHVGDIGDLPGHEFHGNQWTKIKTHPDGSRSIDGYEIPTSRAGLDGAPINLKPAAGSFAEKRGIKVGDLVNFGGTTMDYTPRSGQGVVLGFCVNKGGYSGSGKGKASQDVVMYDKTNSVFQFLEDVNVRLAKKRSKDGETTDAEPRSLYVRRDLVNTDEFVKWAKAQGFQDILPDLHVTITYSRSAVDWMKVGADEWGGGGDEEGQITVKPGGVRIVEKLGNEGAVVLSFSSSVISWRHEQIKSAGASFDYDEYQPHVTITYTPNDVDLSKAVPYRGKLVFGPEIFEETK